MLNVFSQVDLYPLMCKLLQLTPSHQVNGSLAAFEKMMKKHSTDMRVALILMTSLGMVALLFLIIFIKKSRRHLRDDLETRRLNEEDERRYLYHKLKNT